MEQTKKVPERLSHKITMQLKVLGINPKEVNVVGDKSYPSRMALFTESEDSLYPEDIEIQFVSDDKMNSLNELNKGDIVDVTFIIRGKIKNTAGKPDKIWNRFHGLSWEMVHKNVASAGTMQAQTAAQIPQAAPANPQQLDKPAGFNAPDDDLPF